MASPVPATWRLARDDGPALRSGPARLQEVVWPDHGPPHVGDRRAVEPEPFAGLPEVPANYILELAEVNDGSGVKGVDVVNGDQPGRHVPAMLAGRGVLLA